MTDFSEHQPPLEPGDEAVERVQERRSHTGLKVGALLVTAVAAAGAWSSYRFHANAIEQRQQTRTALDLANEGITHVRDLQQTGDKITAIVSVDPQNPKACYIGFEVEGADTSHPTLIWNPNDSNIGAISITNAASEKQALSHMAQIEDMASGSCQIS